MYYGPSRSEDIAAQFRQSASYVDRILKGANPGDLPIQAGNKFSLFINRRTATTFGLEIPPRLLFTGRQGDRVGAVCCDANVATGTKRTNRPPLSLSAFGGIADVAI